MNITAIRQQAKRRDRYSVFVDGVYACSLSEGGLIDSRLAAGQEISEAALQDLKTAAGLDRAYGNTLRYVALRPRSEGELADYFRRKGVDEAASQVIMARLRRVGLVDDLAFARMWVANRRLLKSVSQRRLHQELRQKGIAPGVIAAVLAEDTAGERTALRELIAKKHSRYPDRRKFMQYLVRQGFRYDDIQAALDDRDGSIASAGSF